GEEYYTAPSDSSWYLEGPGLLANDWDLDRDEVSLVLDGSLGIRLDPWPAEASAYDIVVNADGSMRVHTPSGWEGTVYVPYRVSDGVELSELVVAQIHVSSGAWARDDTYVVPGNGQLVVDDPLQGVLANDFNPNQAQLEIDLVETIPADLGMITWNPDGTFTFQAGENWTPDSVLQVTYQLEGCEDQTATVTLVGEEAAAPQLGFVICKLEGNQPKYRFSDKLRVANWEGAFETIGVDAQGLPVVRVKANFIDQESERFYIWLRDLKANINPQVKDRVRVSLKTSSDRGAELELEESAPNSGDFWSPWLILVSVERDDQFAMENMPQDGQLNDRTYFVKLGDTVTATYSVGGNNYSAEAKVPVEYEVEVAVTILKWKPGPNRPRQALVPRQWVQGQVEWANKLLAPAGVKVKLGGEIKEADAPAIPNAPATWAGVQIREVDDLGYFAVLREAIQGKPPRIQPVLSPQERGLFSANLRSPKRNDIDVFVVPLVWQFGQIRTDVGTTPPAPVNAMHGFTYAYVAYNNLYREAAGSILLSALAGEPYTLLAHELVHMLADIVGHPNGREGTTITNLMAVPYRVEIGAVTESRRLTKEQIGRIIEQGTRLGLLSRPGQ
ncbi:MAG: hypothetical protein QW570_09130, partial [Candidatus Caldarchaeum sp.]